MTRPALIVVGLAVWLLALPGAVEAQSAWKAYRIGILHPNDIAGSGSTPLFFKRLRALGYVEGRNITILRKSAHGQRRHLPEMAAELLRREVDVIVGPGSGVSAAIEAARTPPIVVAVAGDFIARGWAESLRRPGGNVTGLSTQASDLTGKQLQLLKETVPGVSRIAIVAVAGDRSHAEELRNAEEATPALGLSLVAILVQGPADLPGAFRRMKTEGVDGIVVLRHGYLLRMRGQMAASARDAGLPTLFGHGREAAAGGLMAYGADTKALWRGAAEYVDKILRGANPAELPISQARKFNLTVNLKTARALGIKIPRAILLRADRVIE